MKRLKKTLNFFLFEGDALEEYLQQMAQEGWMIISISDSLMKQLTFEACTPKKCYFYTDFISNYKSVEEALKYRAFVEEYGYTFVLNQGPLQLFVSDEPIDMPLREQSKETKKELFKVSMKQLYFWIILGLLWIAFPISDIFQGVYKTTYFWNNQYHIFKDIYSFLMGFIYFSFSFPIVIWKIREKKQYSLKQIKIRTFIQIISIPFVLLFFIGGNTSISRFIFLGYALIGVILVVCIFKYLNKRNKNEWIMWGILILLSCILIIGGNSVFHSMKETFLDREYNVVEEMGEGAIPDEYLEIKKPLKYEITKKESMFMKDNQYISRKGEEVISEYEIVNVKNTIMKDFILDSLTTNELLEKERIGRYNIYIQKNKVIISDTTGYLSFPKYAYKVLTQKQLDVIFDYVEDLV